MYMNTLTGYFIRAHRIQQNMSQEGLCKGICVVSYLSKIEQGIVQASSEIIHQLFSVLHITYHDDPVFLSTCENTLHQYMEAYFLKEDTTQYEREINESLADMLCSPLVIDAIFYQITSMMYKQDSYATYEQLLETASLYEPHMNVEQHFLYYLLHCKCKEHSLRLSSIQKAGQYKVCSIQKRFLGIELYTLGRNTEAIECLHQSYQLASQEGNAREMLESSLFLGNCYSNTRDEWLMCTYYAQSERLARSLQEKNVLATIQYNIGSSYLSWNVYDKAKEYLLKALHNFEENDHESNVLIEQKLALLFYELCDTEKMTLHLAECDVEIAYIKDPIIQNMNIFVHRYCEEIDKYSESYIQLLRDLVFNTQDIENENIQIPYGFRIFHATYLMDAYKKIRRYKEALYVMECLNKNEFS